MLQKMGLKAPSHVKTGTTIAGVIFKVSFALECECPGS